jgi:hypothetical protein
MVLWLQILITVNYEGALFSFRITMMVGMALILETTNLLANLALILLFLLLVVVLVRFLRR